MWCVSPQLLHIRIMAFPWFYSPPFRVEVLLHYLVASYLPRLLHSRTILDNGISLTLLTNFFRVESLLHYLIASYLPQLLHSETNLDNGISVTLLPNFFVQRF